MFKSFGELTEESTNLKTEQQKLFNLKRKVIGEKSEPQITVYHHQIPVQK